MSLAWCRPRGKMIQETPISRKHNKSLLSTAARQCHQHKCQQKKQQNKLQKNSCKDKIFSNKTRHHQHGLFKV
ncbi:MAG: hypothetical protein AB8B70_00320 [Prochlorococcus sp.]